ncbi:phosphoribosylaminoimidazolesuccinocarboxamide synthase [Balneolales bacterium ANBcel1]|nr:phosphoribosylaminoimidazolesuccinocarboxamide synthase [Balneolales bacterium ANBcel1]
MKDFTDTRQLLDNCIRESHLPGRPADYRGKVRDIYHLPENQMAIVATDRISAFDHIFAEPIPFKGQLLNQLAWYGFRRVSSICPHHVLEVPHPNVTIARRCEPLPVEVVVRGFLTGHAWRVYREGGRELCGVTLPDGLREHQAFDRPIITPTTKAHQGHDEDISAGEIIRQGLVSRKRWEEIHHTALALFETGSQDALDKGLLLVDTKYEFGLYQNELVLIDEVHTTDSSRFFYADGYRQRLERGEAQKQLSKEFLREWLIESGHHAELDRKLPSLPDDLRITIYQRYRELYETLTGESFEPVDTTHFNRDFAAILERFG